MMQHKPHRRTAQRPLPRARRLALLCALAALSLVLFAACGSASAHTASALNPDSTETRHIEIITYDIPAEWSTSHTAVMGYYHYPPDGGILYVSEAALQPADRSQPEEVLNREIGAMGALFKNVEATSHTDNSFQGCPARQLWFTADVVFDEKTPENTVRAPLYAEVFIHKDIAYTFLFAFPGGEGSEMETHHEAILDSIHLINGPQAASASAE